MAADSAGQWKLAQRPPLLHLFSVMSTDGGSWEQLLEIRHMFCATCCHRWQQWQLVED